MKWKKELKHLIYQSDVVVEVVDARDPEGTRIEYVEKLAGNKLLIVANKSDLNRTSSYVNVSAKLRTRKTLLDAIYSKCNKPRIKVLFVGYPNVGKSSLINMLAGKKAAKVSPIAGTTKGPQWVRIDEHIMATDYRGVFPPEDKLSLLLKSAINFEKDPEYYGYLVAKKVLSDDMLLKWVCDRLDLGDFVGDEENFLVRIARRRNLFVKGGQENIAEAAKVLLRLLKESPKIN